MKAKLATVICLVAFGLVHQGSAATFSVTTTENEGPGSLRTAILNVNSGLVNRIEFRIPPLDDTVKTIVLSNALPSMTNSVAIDGYTQGTASRNTLMSSNDARILIELTVPPSIAALRTFNGLTFGVGNNTVEGLSIHGFDNGIALGSTNGNSRILGNFIGLPPSGGFAGSLSNQHGIAISGPNNWIGGPLPEARNVISGNFGNGISISDARATNNIIQGNFIGTDFVGVGAVPNGAGISLSARYTRIGGEAPGARNVISGNVRDGIVIGLGADYTIVQNNLIGTDVSGTLPLGNDFQGVRVASAFNQIGDASPAIILHPGFPRGNLISANLAGGVFITGIAASNNHVVCNLIGTDIYGLSALGNVGNGITILAQAHGTRIGSVDPVFSTPILGNLVSGNGGSGISIGDLGIVNDTWVTQNKIGTDIDGFWYISNASHGVVMPGARDSFLDGNCIAHNGGSGIAMLGSTSATNNIIQANSIYNNGGIGIDLASINFLDGVTTNDVCDADANSPNKGQNFPVLTFATNTVDGLRIDGFLNAAANTVYVVNFYRNVFCDPSGHGEGDTWLGFTPIMTGPNCSNAFSVLLESYSDCAFLTATAGDLDGNTSEFSQCLAVGERGSCANVPVGMTNWWPGDGITTNLAAGGASVGLSNGTAFAAGKVEAAFSFDGTNDFASVPDSPSLRSASFTLEAWVNFRSVSGVGRRSLMGKPVGSGFNNSYTMFLQNGTMGGAIANASTVSTLLTPFAPATNVWYHLAYTYNRADSNHAFYVNGVLQRRATANVTNSYDANAFMMGADRNAGSVQEFFAGLIDEPTIYDRALASEELQNIFCGGGFGKCRKPFEPCSILCPADIVTNNAAGQCGATVNYPITVTGDCPAVVCSPPSGSFFPIGTNTVTCTTNGVVACAFKIIVNDTERPALTCPANITANTAPGLCTRVVNFNPVVSDNCPGVVLVCDPPSGFVFPKGTTTVTCTAMDAAGNTRTCDFDVTVIDAEPPGITCPADIVTNTAPGSCFRNVTFAPPFLSDNCPGVSAVCNPTSGSQFFVGTNVVTCQATDFSGNTTPCTFKIIIQDQEAPTITCPANVSVEAAAGQANAVVNYPPATASDNCGGVTINSVPPSGSTFPIGTNTVTCTATDAAGNTASCQFLVVVNPPATSPRFSEIRVEGNDIHLSWQARGGTTNRVQAAPALTSTFTNLSPNIIIPGIGVIITNYVDTGGATSGPSRFYRVRLLP